MDSERVGFVGLGQMGWHMAANLARAGVELVVRDANPVVADRFGKAFGKVRLAQHAGDFQGVTMLITMLPNGNAVRGALVNVEGKSSLVEALASNSLLIDMGSSDPATYETLAPKLADRQIGLIDAPVSGNVTGAEAATLTIMAGGDAAHLRRAEPVLRRLGKVIYHTGPLGSGQAMKALNNLVSAAGLMISIEALLLGRRYGLDPRQMNEILNVSTGRNNSTERKIAPFVLSGSYNSGFKLSLMAKDLRAAGALAERSGMKAELTALCVRLVDEAAETLGPDADHTEVARFIESYSGEVFFR